MQTRILAVGTATVDIINEVESYPAEDSKVRVLQQRVSRGGNAANTLAVLSRMGYRCSWAGVIADRPESRCIVEDLDGLSIDLDYAVRCSVGHTPVSYVTSSRQCGSRTIAHYRQLREFDAQDFRVVEPEQFDWIHFEGRDPVELEKMMLVPGVASRCSLEVEKPRPGIERLFPLARAIMFSSDYARHCGFGDGAAFLAAMRAQAQRAALITCSWGSSGAWGMDVAENNTFLAPAPDARVVDTLGAGDVFNAGVIDGILHSRPVSELLIAACRLAGAKCERPGLSLDY